MPILFSKVDHLFRSPRGQVLEMVLRSHVFGHFEVPCPLVHLVGLGLQFVKPSQVQLDLTKMPFDDRIQFHVPIPTRHPANAESIPYSYHIARLPGRDSQRRRLERDLLKGCFWRSKVSENNTTSQKHHLQTYQLENATVSVFGWTLCLSLACLLLPRAFFWR